MFLRRVARPWMMMENVKETTGTVQEPNVVPNARDVLIYLYFKTLNEIKEIPETEGYRKTVEISTINRLKICEEEEDLEKIQKLIGSGHFSELIGKAKDELRIIGNMKKWKVWTVNQIGAPIPKPEHEAGPLTPEFYEALDSVIIKGETKQLRKEAKELKRKKAEELIEKVIV